MIPTTVTQPRIGPRSAGLLTDNIDWSSLRSLEQLCDVEPDEAQHDVGDADREKNT